MWKGKARYCLVDEEARRWDAVLINSKTKRARESKQSVELVMRVDKLCCLARIFREGASDLKAELPSGRDAGLVLAMFQHWRGGRLRNYTRWK